MGQQQQQQQQYQQRQLQLQKPQGRKGGQSQSLLFRRDKDSNQSYNNNDRSSKSPFQTAAEFQHTDDNIGGNDQEENGWDNYETKKKQPQQKQQQQRQQRKQYDIHPYPHPDDSFAYPDNPTDENSCGPQQQTQSMEPSSNQSNYSD